MKKLNKFELYLGVNNTDSYINFFNNNEQKSTPINEMMLQLKREKSIKWSILNPGYSLGLAHMYLGALNQLFKDDNFVMTTNKLEDLLNKVKIHKINDKVKFDKLIDKLNHLRNSIAHHRFDIYIEENNSSAMH